jgi:hypothetical protein
MFQRFHDRFGTVGVVIGVIALILALGGTALAASKLTGPQKKEVAKIAKQEAQKYANSNPGAPGTNGTNGTNGKDGTNGTSATTEAFAGAAHGCTEGGVIVKSASPNAVVCNGQKGANGQTGFTETLPDGATETGVWLTGTTQQPLLNFPIPLKAALAESAVHIVKGSVPSACENPNHPGTASSTNPEAEPGNLCLFGFFSGEAAEYEVKDPTTFAGGASAFGATMAGPLGGGTWAVTGFTP